MLCIFGGLVDVWTKCLKFPTVQLVFSFTCFVARITSFIGSLDTVDLRYCTTIYWSVGSCERERERYIYIYICPRIFLVVHQLYHVIPYHHIILFFHISKQPFQLLKNVRSGLSLWARLFVLHAYPRGLGEEIWRKKAI